MRLSSAHTRTHTHTHAQAHARAYTHTRTHARRRTHTHTHTHKHTYSQAHLLLYIRPTLTYNHVNATLTNSCLNNKVLNWLFPQPGPGGSGVVGQWCTSLDARGWDLWGELLNTLVHIQNGKYLPYFPSRSPTRSCTCTHTWTHLHYTLIHLHKHAQTDHERTHTHTHTHTHSHAHTHAHGHRNTHTFASEHTFYTYSVLPHTGLTYLNPIHSSY